MLLLCASPLGITSVCFAATPAKTNRANPKQKTEELKMGLRGLVAPQGKDAFRELSLTESRIKNCVFTVLYFILFDIILISILLCSRPPKKNFVEVTELTDITYMSNLAKLRPGHMNIVLVLTDASKNILLSKFAKEVYTFTG